MNVDLRPFCAVGVYLALVATPALAADKQPSDEALTGNGTIAAAPTDAEAEKAFRDARKSFFVTETRVVPPYHGDVDLAVSATRPLKIPGGKPENIALSNIRLVLDVEDVTLREIVTRIVQQAAQYTGAWTVKWRLKPENIGLLDERVNLTAEAPFGEFCDLLTERVKNMTGIQLYVTVFQSARIILVTDTYY